MVIKDAGQVDASSALSEICGEKNWDDQVTEVVLERDQNTKVLAEIHFAHNSSEFVVEVPP